MNYFEFHLGDYAKKASHLTMLEHGAYLGLLRKYYVLEKPLPRDPKAVQRLVLCRSAAERKAVIHVLEEFFVPRDDGWHHNRCDEEIERFRARSAQQRAASVLGVKARLNGKPHGTPNGQSSGSPDDDRAVNPRLTPPVSSPQSPDQSPLPPLEKGAVRQRRSKHRAEKDVAAVVWHELISSNGKKRDDRTQAALDAIGGWPRVQQRTAAESERLMRDFCEAYVERSHA